MATSYLKALRMFQPEGPYFLGGWSMGGDVAFEMAQQLQRQGQEVALLALFDTWIGTKQHLGNDAELLASLFEEEASLSLSHESFRQLSSGEQFNYVLEHVKKVNKLLPGTGIAQVGHLLDLYKANIRAMNNYTLGRAYLGRVTLFQCSEQHRRNPLGPQVGWQRFLSNQLEVHLVPGHHHSMLHKPHVQILADQLKICLQNAQAE